MALERASHAIQTAASQSEAAPRLTPQRGGVEDAKRFAANILIKGARHGRGAAPLAEGRNPEHAHATIESDRQHISGPDGTACSVNATPVEANMAGLSKAGCGIARAHDARVPKPLINALAVCGTRRQVREDPSSGAFRLA